MVDWKNTVGMLLGLIALFFGLYAIVALVPTKELAVGFLSFTFGILAIIWTSKAVSSLAPESSLRSYTTKFLFSLVFVLLFSAVNTVQIYFNPQNSMVYLGYGLIIVAYILFVIAAYEILTIGKEFGFGESAAEIRKVIAEKQKKKKK